MLGPKIRGQRLDALQLVAVVVIVGRAMHHTRIQNSAAVYDPPPRLSSAVSASANKKSHIHDLDNTHPQQYPHAAPAPPAARATTPRSNHGRSTKPNAGRARTGPRSAAQRKLSRSAIGREEIDLGRCCSRPRLRSGRAGARRRRRRRMVRVRLRSQQGSAGDAGHLVVRADAGAAGASRGDAEPAAGAAAEPVGDGVRIGTGWRKRRRI